MSLSLWRLCEIKNCSKPTCMVRKVCNKLYLVENDLLYFLIVIVNSYFGFLDADKAILVLEIFVFGMRC